MSDILHNNKNYSVVVSDSEDLDASYDVVNTVTGQVEHGAKSLPEAIDFAEHSNAYLENALWKWINKKGAEMATDEDDLEIEFTPEDSTELH